MYLTVTNAHIKMKGMYLELELTPDTVMMCKFKLTVITEYHTPNIGSRIELPLAMYNRLLKSGALTRVHGYPCTYDFKDAINEKIVNYKMHSPLSQITYAMVIQKPIVMNGITLQEECRVFKPIDIQFNN